MKLDIGATSFKIDVSFAAAVTLTLILDESGVGALALLCCAVHESGHIACLLAIGEKPRSIVLSFYGIKLERSGAYWGRGKEIAVYALGPAANILMALIVFMIGEKLKTAAAISLFVGAFNMIPCRPLDGGNILFLFLCGKMSEDKADKLCFGVSLIFLAPLAATGMAVLLKSGNATLLGVSIYLAAAIFSEKKENKNINI